MTDTGPCVDRQRLAGVIADSLDRYRSTGRSWSEWLAAADAVIAAQRPCLQVGCLVRGDHDEHRYAEDERAGLNHD